MQPRRLISLLLRYLTLGALTTIALAWLLAVFPLKSRYGQLSLRINPDDASPGANHILIAEARAIGSGRFEWAPVSPPTASIDTGPLLARSKAAADRLDSAPPGLDLYQRPEFLCRPHTWPAPAALPRSISIDAGRSTDLRGLPFPALSSSVPIFASMRSGLGPPVSWGIAIRKPTSDMQDPWTAIPLRPILPGFALDTIIWSLLWLALITLFTTTRRSLRHRRGQCPTCAYNLRGLPPNSACPECGTVRP